jgi:hypothetical protein
MAAATGFWRKQARVVTSNSISHGTNAIDAAEVPAARPASLR